MSMDEIKNPFSEFDGMKVRDVMKHLLVVAGASDAEADAMIRGEDEHASIIWEATSRVSAMLTERWELTGHRGTHLAIPVDLYRAFRLECVRQMAIMGGGRFPLHSDHIDFDGIEVFPET